MSDQGLQEAIRAAGGVTELARRIGISQPSVSNWRRVPAERVLAVEASPALRAICCVPISTATINSSVDDVDLARAQHIRAARRAAHARARCRTARAHRRVARRRDAARPRAYRTGRGGRRTRASSRSSANSSICSSASAAASCCLTARIYLTGFLHERPLARLREDLARIGIERAEGVAEPEDHAGILCEIMAGLASGELPAPAGSRRNIFEKHMAPWIGRFFADIERAKARISTGASARLGRVFIEIETEAFALAVMRRAGQDRY